MKRSLSLPLSLTHFLEKVGQSASNYNLIAHVIKWHTGAFPTATQTDAGIFEPGLRLCESLDSPQYRKWKSMVSEDETDIKDGRTRIGK